MDRVLDRERLVVGAVTDSASMMKKLVKNLEIEHQLYHAHGFHTFSDLL